MNKLILALILILIILFSIIAAGILLFDFTAPEEAGGKLYTYPLFLGEKTYVVTVATNWTSAPEVYLPEIDHNYVSVDFRGPLRATVFFNVTVPADLIWGNISVVWKYYEQSPESYMLCYNGTSYSVSMTFYHIATVEHFEIRGTEGAWAYSVPP